MKVSINSLTPKRIEEWNKFLRSNPNNTVFQSYDMYLFYKKVQNFEPFLFLCEDDNSKCKGVLLAVRIKEGSLIKGFLSSRIVIYGGPIIIEDEKKQEVLELLLKTLVNELAHRCIFIQFRNFFNWNDHEKQVFNKNGFSFRDRLNLLVVTKDGNTAISSISNSKQRQISYSIRSGAKITDPESLDEVRVLYKMLESLYNNKVKKPFPTWSFFKEFYNLSIIGKLGIIKLIKIDNTIIGGIVCPVTKGKNIYEWYVVGLDREFKKNYPSVLATWAPIEFAIQNKLQYFDFMGLGKPENSYGVRDFKLKFGNNVVNYGRFGRRNKLLYPIVEFAYIILRNLYLFKMFR